MVLTLYVTRDYDKMSTFSANYAIQMIGQKTQQLQPVNVTLSTGNTPKLMNEIMVERQREWRPEMVTLVQLDENVTPGGTQVQRWDHPQCYSAEITRFLSQLSPQIAGHIYPFACLIDGRQLESSVNMNAEGLQLKGSRSGKVIISNGYLDETLDVVISTIGRFRFDIGCQGSLFLTRLGLGRDCHVGFQEAGTPDLEGVLLMKLADETVADSMRDYGLNTDYVSKFGITLSARYIVNNSENILIMVSGRHKSSAVYHMLVPEPTMEAPASLFQTRAGNPTSRDAIVLDEGAADLILSSQNLDAILAKGIRFHDMR